jgi:Flp pilus assembly protein TadB
LQHQIRAGTLGTSVAGSLNMNHHWKAVLALTSGFVVAFIVALAFHSLVAALMLLLSALVVAYVLGIAGMRTAPPRQMRRKQASLP